MTVPGPAGVPQMTLDRTGFFGSRTQSTRTGPGFPTIDTGPDLGFSGGPTMAGPVAPDTGTGHRSDFGGRVDFFLLIFTTPHIARYVVNLKFSSVQRFKEGHFPCSPARYVVSMFREEVKLWVSLLSHIKSA